MYLRFGLTVTGAGVAIDTESIEPNEKLISVDGDSLRRTVALSATEYTTLDTGDLTPKWWFLMNVLATQDLVCGFGSADDITLSPGEFNFIRSSKVMFGKGSGGASTLLYAVIT
jgi:hypothetical protein